MVVTVSVSGILKESAQAIEDNPQAFSCDAIRQVALSHGLTNKEAKGITDSYRRFYTGTADRFWLHKLLGLKYEDVETPPVLFEMQELRRLMLMLAAEAATTGDL